MQRKYLEKKFFSVKLNKNLINNLLHTMNFLCTNVAALNTQSLKDIANIFNEKICLSSRFKYQWYLVAIKATKSKLHPPIPPKEVKKTSRNKI